MTTPVRFSTERSSTERSADGFVTPPPGSRQTSLRFRSTPSNLRETRVNRFRVYGSPAGVLDEVDPDEASPSQGAKSRIRRPTRLADDEDSELITGFDEEAESISGFGDMKVMFSINVMGVLGERYFTYRDDLSAEDRAAYHAYYASLKMYIRVSYDPHGGLDLAVHYPGFFEGEEFDRNTPEGQYMIELATYYKGVDVVDITEALVGRLEETREEMPPALPPKVAAGSSGETPFEGATTSPRSRSATAPKVLSGKLIDLVRANFDPDSSDCIAGLEDQYGKECELTGIMLRDKKWHDDGFFYYTSTTLKDYFRDRLAKPIDGGALPGPGRMLARSALHVHLMLILGGNGASLLKITDVWRGYKKLDTATILSMSSDETVFNTIFNAQYTKHAIKTIDTTAWEHAKYSGRLMLRSTFLPPSMDDISIAARHDVIMNVISPALRVIDGVIDLPLLEGKAYFDHHGSPSLEATLFGKIRRARAAQIPKYDPYAEKSVYDLLYPEMGTVVYYWIANAVAGTFSDDDLNLLQYCEDWSAFNKYKTAYTEFFPWTLGFVQETVNLIFDRQGPNSVATPNSLATQLEAGYKVAQRFQTPGRFFEDGPMATRIFYALFCEDYENVNSYIWNTNDLQDHAAHGSVLNLIQLSAVGGIINKLKNAPVIICDPDSNAIERRDRIIEAWDAEAVDDKLRLLARAVADVGIYSFWMGGVSQRDVHVIADPSIQIMGAGFSHLRV